MKRIFTLIVIAALLPLTASAQSLTAADQAMVRTGDAKTVTEQACIQLAITAASNMVWNIVMDEPDMHMLGYLSDQWHSGPYGCTGIFHVSWPQVLRTAFESAVAEYPGIHHKPEVADVLNVLEQMANEANGTTATPPASTEPSSPCLPGWTLTDMTNMGSYKMYACETNVNRRPPTPSCQPGFSMGNMTLNVGYSSYMCTKGGD